MNCKNANQKIHLFTELAEGERELVLHHISVCKQCMELFESVQTMNIAMNRISKFPLEPSDSFRLTNRIMNEINTTSHQPFTVLDWFIYNFELKRVKLTMAGVSVLLTFLFGLEQIQVSRNSSQYSAEVNATSQTTILNARKFQDQLNVHKRSEKAARLNECKNPFKSRYLNVACLREKNAHFKTL